MGILFQCNNTIIPSYFLFFYKNVRKKTLSWMSFIIQFTFNIVSCYDATGGFYPLKYSNVDFTYIRIINRLPQPMFHIAFKICTFVKEMERACILFSSGLKVCAHWEVNEDDKRHFGYMLRKRLNKPFQKEHSNSVWNDFYPQFDASRCCRSKIVFMVIF